MEPQSRSITGGNRIHYDCCIVGNFPCLFFSPSRNGNFTEINMHSRDLINSYKSPNFNLKSLNIKYPQLHGNITYTQLIQEQKLRRDVISKANRINFSFSSSTESVFGRRKNFNIEVLSLIFGKVLILLEDRIFNYNW